jgi:SAM-dependent methyltransferase
VSYSLQHRSNISVSCLLLCPSRGVEFEYLRDQEYILCECADCELIYQQEIPNNFLLHKIYEEWIDPKKCFELYERPRRIQYFSYLSSEIIGLISLFDRPPMELKFLDFSMGWGHWSRIAQSFGCTVYSTEFSPSKIDYARHKGVQVIDYTDIQSHQFDFINTEQVFEHLPDIRSTLTYLKGSLKAGGLLKISVPNAPDIKKRLKTWNWNAPKGSSDSLNPVAPLEHINCFNHSSLIQLAKRCGLVPIGHGKDFIHQLRMWSHPHVVKKTAKTIVRQFWHLMQGNQSSPLNKDIYILFRESDGA